MSTNPLPPLPASLIRALLPAAEQAEVLDDLASEYRERLARQGALRARYWVWRQAIGSLPALFRRSWWRGWTGFEPQSSAFNPGGPSMEQWIMDVRYAARRLFQRPQYALLAILTLALGIGGTAAIAGIARGVLLNPLPYSDPDRVALFWMPGDWYQQEFAFLRGQTPGFSKLAQYRHRDLTLESGNAPARLVPGVSGSAELFHVLGATPMLGRTFEPDDEVIGAERVAVLSYGLWQNLGGDQSLVGTRIRLDGTSYTVVGVMPRGFWFPSPAERVWVPQPLNSEERVGNFSLVGRVAPGNDVHQMGGPLAALTGMLGERFQYPAQWDKTKNAAVTSIKDSVIGPLRPAIAATMAAMAIILLMACANVAALMLGQVEGRTVELAVRSALGADRLRLTRQLVAESVVLGTAAGVAGAAVAVLCFSLLVNALPLGAWSETAALDWRVFVLAMTVAVGSALVISLAPISALWRGRLRGALTTGRTVGITGRGIRLESALVVTEVALAVLLAAGSGVLVRSIARFYAIETGLNARGVGVIDLVLPSDLDNNERRRILDNLVLKVRAVPGIENAALTQRLPLRGGGWSSGISVQGRPNEGQSTTYVRFVSPGYFETMGIPLKEGRSFDATDLIPDGGDSLVSASVINESLARKYFDGLNPIGLRVSNGFTSVETRVVGIATDVAEGALTDDPAPVRYMPYTAIPFTASSQTLVFRTVGSLRPVALLERVRRTIVGAAPRVAVAEATTMDQVLALAVGPARQLMTLVTLLTGLALLLGAIGIYGVMSHFVARRKRDWGIRIALGLNPARVVSGVVGRGSRLVALGVVLGLGGFVLLGKFLKPLIYGIGPTDPAALASATIGLLLVGVLAALLPAARASRTDPATVLREQ